MILNKKLLLAIPFQLDEYLEMFPANCLEEALMIGGKEPPELEPKCEVFEPEKGTKGTMVSGRLFFFGKGLLDWSGLY